MAVYEPRDMTLPDGEHVTLRSPTEADAAALIEYLDAVRRETEMIMYGPDDELPTLDEERNFIRDCVESPGSAWIMAEAEGRPIGVANVGRNRFVRQRHVANLGISLRAAWHGRGLGTLMMKRLIDWARDEGGYERLTLTVFADNVRAIHLYEKLGFRREGLHPRHVRRAAGRYVDVISMGLALRAGPIEEGVGQG